MQLQSTYTSGLPALTLSFLDYIIVLQSTYTSGLPEHYTHMLKNQKKLQSTYTSGLPALPLILIYTVETVAIYIHKML